MILACRNPSRGEEALRSLQSELPSAEAELVILDLADLDSVRDVADDLTGRLPSLDLLLNNAGVMAIPGRRETPQGFELQFGTNHLGHFALTGRLMPLLLASPGARVVTISSNNHRMARGIPLEDLQSERDYSAWRAYNRSKLANVLFMLEMSRRIRLHRVQSLLSVGAHPGFSHTNLQTAGPQLDGERFSSRVMSLGVQLLGQRQTAGALPSLYAATAPEAECGGYYGPSGPGELRGAPKSAKVSPRAHDEIVRRRLWELSSELTGVTFDALEPGA